MFKNEESPKRNVPKFEVFNLLSWKHEVFKVQLGYVFIS